MRGTGRVKKDQELYSPPNQSEYSRKIMPFVNLLTNFHGLIMSYDIEELIKKELSLMC